MTFQFAIIHITEDRILIMISLEKNVLYGKLVQASNSYEHIYTHFPCYTVLFQLLVLFIIDARNQWRSRKCEPLLTTFIPQNLVCDPCLLILLRLCVP